MIVDCQQTGLHDIVWVLVSFKYVKCIFCLISMSNNKPFLPTLFILASSLLLCLLLLHYYVSGVLLPPTVSM